MKKKPIDSGWCPRCKSHFPMMTKIVNGVVFCHLCGCDLLEIKSERVYWVQFAKNYVEEMMVKSVS